MIMHIESTLVILVNIIFFNYFLSKKTKHPRASSATPPPAPRLRSPPGKAVPRSPAFLRARGPWAPPRLTPRLGSNEKSHFPEERLSKQNLRPRQF